MQTLQVHQAIYGERNRGHALLASSGGDAPFADIVPLTDRPESAPSEAHWVPYLHGFIWDQWYVLAKTFPDPSASRGGMVFTHALLGSARDVTSLQRLDLLARHLIASPNRCTALEPIIVADVEEDTSALSPPGLGATAAALLRAAGSPVVWIGQDGFDDLVFALWARLWPAGRRSLQFGFAFSPHDLEGQHLTLVATPRAFEARWHGFPCIRPEDGASTSAPEASADASLALQYLLDPTHKGELGDLFLRLEVEPSSFADVVLAARAFPLLVELASDCGTTRTPDADKLRALARAVAKLSSDPARALILKRSVLNALADATARGTAADVIALRNFDLEPFVDGSVSIRSALTHWFRSTAGHLGGVAAGPTHTAHDAGKALELAAEARTPWAELVTSAAAEVVAAWPPGMADVLWRWWTGGPASVAILGQALPRDVEGQLATACPASLTRHLASALRTVAHTRRWPVLHAAILAASSPPEEAFAEQRAADLPMAHEAYRAIAARVAPAETLRAALASDDPVLAEIAGEVCAAHPALMAGLDVAQPRWLGIWNSAQDVSGDVWRGVRDPDATRDALLSSVVSGAACPPPLVLAVARSLHANLLGFSRRENIWRSTFGSFRDALVAATAEAWLAALLREPAGPSAPPTATKASALEPELKAAVLDHGRVEQALTSPTVTVSGVLQLFDAAPELDETAFLRWLVGRDGRLLSTEAQALGELVQRRRWENVSRELFRLFTRDGRTDLRSAVESCASLVTRIHRLQLRLLGWAIGATSLHEDDAWSELINVAAQLYSWGPGYNDVWQRAGGDPAKLPRRDNGHASWTAAIQLVRHGGGGNRITARRLLDAMIEDFPRHEPLRILRDMPEFSDQRR